MEDEPAQCFPEVTPTLVEKRTVQVVLSHDIIRRKGENFFVFWIKWEGLPLWDASWEEEADLLSIDPQCASLLEKYKQLYCPVWGFDAHLDTFSSDDEQVVDDMDEELSECSQ
jgi:hypothetical protein